MAETTKVIGAGTLNKLELTPEMLGDAPKVLEPETQDIPIERERMQNLMDNEQFVFVDGKRWTLAPFQIADIPKKVAVAFAKDRASYVRRYAREPGYVEQGEAIVWLANGSGNPFAPESIEREVVRKGKVEYERMDNPLRRPRHQRWTLHIGQKVVQVDTGNGLEMKAINFPPKVFELAPFERKPFAQKYAERALERDSFREIHDQGQVISCRTPDPSEPNGSWSYEEIRLYAEMMDQNTFSPLLKSKFVVGEKIKNDRHKEELKAELMTYLFFRLIDSRFPLIPYEVFEAERGARKIPASA